MYFKNDFWISVSISHITENIVEKSCLNEFNREFPGGPLAKTLHSQCSGPGFYPCSGN